MSKAKQVLQLLDSDGTLSALGKVPSPSLGAVKVGSTVWVNLDNPLGDKKKRKSNYVKGKYVGSGKSGGVLVDINGKTSTYTSNAVFTSKPADYKFVGPLGR